MIIGGLIGIIIVCLSEKTDPLVVLSVLGAVVMYILSMISLFILRRKEPALERPFKVPLYPWCPAIALVLSVLALCAIVYYNGWLSALFFGGLAIAIFIFVVTGKNKLLTEEETLRGEIAEPSKILNS